MFEDVLASWRCTRTKGPVRQMLRLRKRFQLNRRQRDRLGLVCAAGSVVCLASMVAHWSQPLPVERSPWEQDLFGDLRSEVSGPANPTGERSHQAHAEESAELNDEVAETLDRPLSPVPLGAIDATPIDQRPANRQPRFVQPVAHEEEVSPPLAWLSGRIEDAPEESTTTGLVDETSVDR